MSLNRTATIFVGGRTNRGTLQLLLASADWGQFAMGYQQYKTQDESKNQYSPRFHHFSIHVKCLFHSDEPQQRRSVIFIKVDSSQ
jgi:hypothetical protein